MKTLALYNVKGGVGKTAAAVNLAYLAAESGIPTLLWDLDAQGAASWYLHGETDAAVKTKKVLEGETPLSRLVKPTPYENLGVIPADFSYRYLDILLRKVEPPRHALQRLMKPFGRQYKLMVLDCPPSLSHLADNVFAAADLVLVPVVPTHLSLRALQQLRDYFAQEGFDGTRIKPFYSMADRRRALHNELLDHPPKLLAGVCRAPIPYSAMIERMGEHRAPVTAFAPKDHVSGLAYRALWKEVRRGLEL